MSIVGYVRISQRENSGLGLDFQKEALNKYARDKNKSIKIFEDNGYSGGLPIEKRPGLQKALDHLKKDSIFLIYRRDRMSRDLQNTLFIELTVKKKKSKIISICGEGTDADPDDANAFIFRTMIDGFAQFEKMLIGSRTKNAMKQLKSRKCQTGTLSYGFKLDLNEDGTPKKHIDGGKLLIVDENEQAVIKMMQDLQAEGNCPYKIARILNERGIKKRERITKPGSKVIYNNDKWNNKNIVRILSNVEKHKCLHALINL